MGGVRPVRLTGAASGVTFTKKTSRFVLLRLIWEGDTILKPGPTLVATHTHKRSLDSLISARAHLLILPGTGSLLNLFFNIFYEFLPPLSVATSPGLLEYT